jgi:hypothetical protein
MTKVVDKTTHPIKNNNLQQMKSISNSSSKNDLDTKLDKAKDLSEKKISKNDLSKTEITNQAKAMNAAEDINAGQKESMEQSSSSEMADKASSVAKAISKVPVLPISLPSVSSKALSKNSDKKISDKKPEPPIHYIKKPAVIFIEGFSAFGISNGDGIKDMAENYPDAKLFNWTDHDEIVKEIKKHAPNEPVVLVGHSFGGDTAVEVANELNSAKNMFRAIELIVSIDAVGMNKSIIPINVKNNLNYFGEGLIPFLHGDPTVARNTKYTDVTNELRTDMHSKMDDSPEVQFEIFSKINQAVGNNSESEAEVVFEIGDKSQLKELLETLKNSL